MFPKYLYSLPRPLPHSLPHYLPVPFHTPFRTLSLTPSLASQVSKCNEVGKPVIVATQVSGAGSIYGV